MKRPHRRGARKLLHSLYQESPYSAEVCRRRPLARLLPVASGRANAIQVGPLQGSCEAGRQLLLDASQRLAGERVYLDVPIDHTEAVAAAQLLGLNVERHLLRMGRGRRLQENLSLFWSSFGPEKG